MSDTESKLMPQTVGEQTKYGISACPGIAIGRAYIVDRRQLKVPKRQIDADEVESEVERFRRAVDASERQLDKIKHKIEAREQDHYNIITAHQLILRDDHIVKATITSISDERINAEWALRKSVEAIKSVFDAVEDDYFRERRSDVEFVGERVLRNLLGRDNRVSPPPDAIVIAHDLSPADTAQLYRAAVAGIATDIGGKTSHTAIVARGYQTPAVVGLEDLSSNVGNDDLVIVDGTGGLVIVNPDAETVARYRERARQEIAAGLARLSTCDQPALTKDGTKVELLANLDHVAEVKLALEHGAEGIGLFRTEYPFMASKDLPTEEDHYQYAIEVIEGVGDKVITFRTLDLGADKVAGLLLEQHEEPNPALGLRSLRLCLSKKLIGLFRCQLRGLLRASAKGRLRLMFPMVSGVEELEDATALLEEVKAELRAEGTPFDEELPVGIMIEMPSAALVADLLAERVDFFSIGTNDLIQYTMAVDRLNEYVSYLYEPLHPAILRLLQKVIRAANEHEIPVSLCGEMAGDPFMTPVLLGLGLRTLSMPGVAMPQVKDVVRRTSIPELESLAHTLLSLPTGKLIREAVKTFMDGCQSEDEA